MKYLLLILLLSACGSDTISTGEDDPNNDPNTTPTSSVRSIVIKDNDGETVGYLIDMSLDEGKSYEALILNLYGQILKINVVTGEIIKEVISYTTLNCTGQIYFNEGEGLVLNRVVKNDNLCYKITSFTNNMPKNSNKPTTGGCGIATESMVHAGLLTPIDEPNDFSAYAPLVFTGE